MKNKSTDLRKRSSPNALSTLMQLITLGIGLGVITGSVIKNIAIKEIEGELELAKIFSLDKYLSYKNKKLSYHNRFSILESKSKKREIYSLSQSWDKLAKEHKDLKASGYLIFLEDGKYAALEADKKLPAASSIKIYILLVTLQMLDSGQLRWNEKLTLNKEDVAGEAGWMAYQPLGTSFPVYEIAKEMIRVSDNTASNLLIKRIGGIKVLNERFKSLGLKNTQLNNLLPDLKGTNVSSTKDLVRAISMVDTGEVLSTRARDLFREIMQTSVTNRLLPGGIQKGLKLPAGKTDYRLLLKGYRVLNKTGDIGIAYADAGLIETPNNKRVVAAFIVKGPFNDPRSSELIRDMSAAMVPILEKESTSKN